MSASRAQQRLWRNVYGDTLNAFPCRREIPVEQLSELLRMVWQPEKFTVREPEPSIRRRSLNKQLRERYRRAASPACLRFPGPGAPAMKAPDAQSRSLRGKQLLRVSCPFRIPWRASSPYDVDQGRRQAGAIRSGPVARRHRWASEGFSSYGRGQTCEGQAQPEPRSRSQFSAADTICLALNQNAGAAPMVAEAGSRIRIILMSCYRPKPSAGKRPPVSRPADLKAANTETTICLPYHLHHKRVDQKITTR